jgi:predicted transcriptional regulator
MIYLGIKIEKETKARIAEIAKRDDRSISSVTRLAILNGLSFFDSGVSHPKTQKFVSGVCHPTKQ